MSEDIDIRVQSLYIELENAQTRLEDSLNRIKSDMADELNFVKERRIYLNTLKYKNPRPRMNFFLKDFNKFRKCLQKSDATLEGLVQKLSNFRISTKSCPKDKSVF